MTSGGFSASEVAEIVTARNANDTGTVCVTDASALVDGTYSTVYVGETDAFDAYGNVKGLAGTIAHDCAQDGLTVDDQEKPHVKNKQPYCFSSGTR